MYYSRTAEKNYNAFYDYTTAYYDYAMLTFFVPYRSCLQDDTYVRSLFAKRFAQYIYVRT